MTTAIADTKPQTKAVAKVDWTRPTDKNGLEKLGGLISDQLQKSLPGFLQKQGKQNADRMIRALILQAQKTPKLMECSPMSLFGACIEAARLGLEIGGSLGHAYLIPFKGQAQLIIGYKGFNDLAWRSNKVVGVQVGKHCLKDSFEYELGTESFLRHKPADGDRGIVLKYYVTIETTTGKNFDMMTVQELLDFRNRYALTKGSGPWYECVQDGDGFKPFNGFDWMAWKTIYRRMCKFLPLSPELQTAVTIDEDSERGELQPYQESVTLLTGAPEQPGIGAGETTKTSDELRKRMENTRGQSGAAEETNGNGHTDAPQTLGTYLRAAAKKVSDCDGAVSLSNLLNAVDADLAAKDPKHTAGELLTVARRGAAAKEDMAVSKFSDKQLAAAKTALVAYLEQIGLEGNE